MITFNNFSRVGKLYIDLVCLGVVMNAQAYSWVPCGQPVFTCAAFDSDLSWVVLRPIIQIRNMRGRQSTVLCFPTSNKCLTIHVSDRTSIGLSAGVPTRLSKLAPLLQVQVYKYNHDAGT